MTGIELAFSACGPASLASNCVGVVSFPGRSSARREVEGNLDLHGETLFEELGSDLRENNRIGFPLGPILR